MRRHPDLSYERDATGLNNVSSYIFREWAATGGSPSILVKPWLWRRAHRLSVTHDVLHELWRELRVRGELNNDTMFTRQDRGES